METPAVREEPFPAPSRAAAGTVNGVPTEVARMDFSDKILITLSQDGRVAQWVQVPLAAPSPALVDMALPTSGLGTLPSLHLTPTTLLGRGGEDRETHGHLYAAQIATHLSRRDPDDRRTLVLGLGVRELGTGREAFFDVLELVQKVL